MNLQAVSYYIYGSTFLPNMKYQAAKYAYGVQKCIECEQTFSLPQGMLYRAA